MAKIQMFYLLLFRSISVASLKISLKIKYLQIGAYFAIVFAACFTAFTILM